MTTTRSNCLTTPADPRVVQAARHVRDQLDPPDPTGAVWGMILGSGLGHIGDVILERGGRAISYTDIPHFPGSGVPGHRGRLVIGAHAGSPVFVLQGRAHFYEGHSVEDITLPARTLLELGISHLLVTNAAGAVNERFKPGDLMLIDDHINRLPAQFGPIATASGPVWCAELRENVLSLAKQQRISIQRGVYAANAGPTYETPAEVRMARFLGADAVGMSTVPEALAAAGRAKVVGISCITNMAAGVTGVPISHDEVAEVGAQVRDEFGRLVLDIVAHAALGA